MMLFKGINYFKVSGGKKDDDMWDFNFMYQDPEHIVRKQGKDISCSTTKSLAIANQEIGNMSHDVSVIESKK